MIPELVDSVMEPLELDDVLRRFDRQAEFKAVPFRELPACECGTPDCAGLAAEAVVSYHHWVPPVSPFGTGYRSHTYRHAFNGGCLGWELRQLTSSGARLVPEKLTVEILMIKKERA